MTEPQVRCQMQLVCDVRWQAMTPTERADVRHCQRCDRPVFQVTTEQEFHAQASAGQCVAFLPEQVAVELAEAWPHGEMLAGKPAFADPPESKRKPWWKRWRP